MRELTVPGKVFRGHDYSMGGGDRMELTCWLEVSAMIPHCKRCLRNFSNPLNIACFFVNVLC